MHAAPVLLRDEVLCVLNLFRRVSGPLPEADRQLAWALADATAIPMLQQTTLDQHRTLQVQLQQALDTRSIVEQPQVPDRPSQNRPSPPATGCAPAPATTTCAWPISPARHRRGQRRPVHPPISTPRKSEPCRSSRRVFVR
ncbi:hypothetical protein ACFYWU_41640 [Streptomyces chrestomyceticus]|uniref:hypothetical protein n=1 Tax=Streptomyces chrestomyceticus TaxID=68185 RepID=UPI0036B9229F